MENIITDENFKAEIGGKELPVLVDFFATWCEPCSTLAPILEKVAKDYEGRLVLLKANLDNIPLTAQMFSVNQIPMVILFDKGKPVSGFVGARPEEIVREWLEQFLKQIKKTEVGPVKDAADPAENIIKEYADYAQKNGYRLNPDAESVKRIASGLMANEKKYGQKYCPCRRVTGNPEEDKKNICPCVYHKAEIEKDGHCLCNLFLK